MTTTLAATPYRLRSITSRDRARLTRFYAGLSTDSSLARFHGGVPTIPEATGSFFCGPDHQHREGIVAECLDATGDPVIIGHVCIDPMPDGSAEMAIAVADTWQRHGVGRAMLARAITWAQSNGISRFVASMRCGNTAVLDLLRSMGHPMTCGASVGGTVDAYLAVRSSSLAA